MADYVKWLDTAFGVYEPSTDWNAVSGLYVFAARQGSELAGYSMARPVCGADAIPRKPSAHSRKVVGGSAAGGHAHPCPGRRVGG